MILTKHPPVYPDLTALELLHMVDGERHWYERYAVECDWAQVILTDMVYCKEIRWSDHLFHMEKGEPFTADQYVRRFPHLVSLGQTLVRFICPLIEQGAVTSNLANTVLLPTGPTVYRERPDLEAKPLLIPVTHHVTTEEALAHDPAAHREELDNRILQYARESTSLNRSLLAQALGIAIVRWEHGNPQDYRADEGIGHIDSPGHLGKMRFQYNGGLQYFGYQLPLSYR